MTAGYIASGLGCAPRALAIQGPGYPARPVLSTYGPCSTQKPDVALVTKSGPDSRCHAFASAHGIQRAVAGFNGITLRCNYSRALQER